MQMTQQMTQQMSDLAKVANIIVDAIVLGNNLTSFNLHEIEDSSEYSLHFFIYDNCRLTKIMKSTKQNNCKLVTTTKSEMFSPIKLLSPKSFQGKNLTGIARRISDLAVDIHANIQQWNSLHLEGFTYLKDITQEKCDKKYSDALQDLCDKLEDICNSLDGIVRNLDQIKQHLIAIAVLHKTTDKLFTTWSTSKFGEMAKTIYDAYHKEAKLKRNILENVTLDHTESWKMLHLTAWTYQPFLSENLTILLDSLLIETGHKG